MTTAKIPRHAVGEALGLREINPETGKPYPLHDPAAFVRDHRAFYDLHPDMVAFDWPNGLPDA